MGLISDTGFLGVLQMSDLFLGLHVYRLQTVNHLLLLVLIE